MRVVLSLTLLLLSLLVGAAVAQEPEGAATPLVAAQSEAVEALARRVDALEAAVTRDRENDALLVDVRLALEDVAREVLESGVAFRPRLAEINARLGELGPPPGAGEPAEPEAVAAERRALGAEKSEINAVLGTAEQLALRVGALVERVASLRRELFAQMLTRRYAIDYTLAGEVVRAFRDEVAEVARSVGAWLGFVSRFKLRSALLAATFALGAAALLLIGGRRLVGPLLVPNPAETDPSNLTRLSVAFWSTFLPTAALIVFLSAVWFLLDGFGVLRGDIGGMLASLFRVAAAIYFVYRLARAALAPRLPHWRLVPVESRAAALLVMLVSATAFFWGVNRFLADVYEMRGSPLSLTVGESLVSTVVTGILIVLIGLVKPFADADGTPRRWPPAVRALLFLLGGLIIVAGALGYIGLARFMARQIVVTGAILATMYMGLLSARAVADEGAFAGTSLGRAVRRRLRLEDRGLEGLALAVGVLLNLLVLAVGIPLILLQWGFQPSELRDWLNRAATGFTVGSVRFSPLGLATGIAVFALGYFLTRRLQGWLDGQVLARGRVDAGVRNSVRLVVGYAGLALAGVVALGAAGIDLSSLALVAGALSLGIGFGLQNIVNNFVSGLILLAERPFKVGDWIVAGAVTGTVKKISVRATEIETFQRQTVILPNSDLINGAVGNWTHRNRTGRLDVRVNVAYGMNARRAHDVMLEAGRAHPQVLRNPEPAVVFLNFGAAALEMELRVFLADVLTQNAVQNDLRFAILDGFAREGIEMASAPRAVVVEPPAPAGGEAGEGDGGRAEPRRPAAR